MPAKSKDYKYVMFTPEIINEAVEIMLSTMPEDKRELRFKYFELKLGDGETWQHSNEEEFWADYRKACGYVAFNKNFDCGDIRLQVIWPNTTVKISLPNRTDIERVFNVLESQVEKCRIQPKIRVFIGHGRSFQWRDLKDHLHEKHSIDVEAYETSARTGLSITSVLDNMLTNSSFAILVLTGEDIDAAGELHARENVIHELGLFQGRLGWRKAIILLEEGVTEFSNIQGLNQIRFHAGNIQETFGEVLATIKREF